jgi:hypothetical protein
MKLPKRLLAVAGVATGTAIPLLFAATAANAAPSTSVKVVTHLSNRADTAPSGNVWAYDNVSRQFTISGSNGHYTVNVTDNGSFTAIADPGTGAPISATGSLTGTETWDVTGVTGGVSANALSSQTPADVASWQMIDKLLPGATYETTNITSYTFSYRSDNGSTYSQVQPASGDFSVKGDITG